MRLAVLFLTVSCIFLAACGSSAPTPTVTTTMTAPIQVQVKLTEFGIESSLQEFQTRVPYEFVITNTGAIPHEFMISPVAALGHGMHMADMHKDAIAVVTESELPAGAVKTITVMFQPDANDEPLEFACHVVGHYEAGMKMPIRVI